MVLGQVETNVNLVQKNMSNADDNQRTIGDGSEKVKVEEMPAHVNVQVETRGEHTWVIFEQIGTDWSTGQVISKKFEMMYPFSNEDVIENCD